MGLEKIKEEILSKTKKDEEQILAPAKGKVKEIESMSKLKIKELESKSKKKLDSDCLAIENRETSLLNIEVKKLISDGKQKSTLDAYLAGLDKLKNLDRTENETFIANLLKIAEKEIDIGVIYADKKDIDVVKALSKDATVKPLDIGGGIICETADEKVRVDLTINNLFNDFKDKSFGKVSEILFKK